MFSGRFVFAQLRWWVVSVAVYEANISLKFSTNSCDFFSNVSSLLSRFSSLLLWSPSEIRAIIHFECRSLLYFIGQSEWLYWWYNLLSTSECNMRINNYHSYPYFCVGSNSNDKFHAVYFHPISRYLPLILTTQYGI